MIKFGISGWRGIIAEEFTYRNVAVVTQAIANLIKEEYKKVSVIIGYDTRFISEDFAKTAAEKRYKSAAMQKRYSDACNSL
jgi:phosphomannomutase